MARSTNLRTSLIAVVALLGLGLGTRPLPLARAAAQVWSTQELVVLRSGAGADASFLAQPVAAFLAQPTTAPSIPRHLPLGLLDHAGTTLYSAGPAGPGRTLLRAVDVASGRTLRRMVLPGIYTTRTGEDAVGDYPLSFHDGTSVPQGHPAAVTAAPVLASRVLSPARAAPPADGSEVLSALSFNGRWLALREPNASTQGTHFLVIDTAGMRVVDDQFLTGLFGLDAISDDGGMLYLIQSLDARGYGYYQVRCYLVAHKRLDPRVVLAPGETPGSMNGVAWTRAWSPDGSWLYTLYTKDSSQVFIHALHLPARRTWCIDFPALAGAGSGLYHFTLSVTPDGTALYAANPVLGLVAAVHDLPAGKVTVASLKVRTGAPQRPQAGAAISADGGTLFVASGSGILAIDTATLTLQTTLLPGQEIASVAIDHRGWHLYALAQAGLTLDTLEPGTGAITGAVRVNAPVWAIEQVSGAR